MKRRKMIWICLLCLLMTACSNEFARREYNSDEKISRPEDHYTKVLSVFTSTNGECSLTVSEFDGRQSLWAETLKKDLTVDLSFSFRLSKGLAKLVHIDDDGNVTTLIECSPDTPTDGFVTKTVSFKSGQNRLKIVGYDCKDMELKIRLAEPG